MGSVEWQAIGGGVLDDLFDAPAIGPDFGDRYELRGELGAGGQGRVYRCWDRSCEREVAIKRLRDPGGNQMPLRSEARLLSRLAHPAIPQIYDTGRSPDGGVFVAMQFIDGRRLGEVVHDEELNLAGRVHLFRSIAGAVQHSHARGILHRDLKPENILVTVDYEPYIVDWGLAAHGGPRAICGSPHFAAPEQLEGQVADQRADIYPLGVLFYFILSRGELPYGRRARDFHEFRQLRAGLSQVPLRQRDPRLPAALGRICGTAMAPQPGARYRSVRAMLRDLDSFEQGRPLARDLPQMPWRRLRAAAALIVCAGGGFALGSMGGDAETSTAEPPAPTAASAGSSSPAATLEPGAASAGEDDGEEPQWPERLVFRSWPDLPQELDDDDDGGAALAARDPVAENGAQAESTGGDDRAIEELLESLSIPESTPPAEVSDTDSTDAGAPERAPGEQAVNTAPDDEAAGSGQDVLPPLLDWLPPLPQSEGLQEIEPDAAERPGRDEATER